MSEDTQEEWTRWDEFRDTVTAWVGGIMIWSLPAMVIIGGLTLFASGACQEFRSHGDERPFYCSYIMVPR